MNTTLISRWSGEFLSWLLGVKNLSTDELSRFEINFQNQFATLALFILAALAAIALVVWCAKREQPHLSHTRRMVLGLLRVAALLVLLLIIFLPFVKFKYTETNTFPLVLLIDSTDSMNIADVRISEADLAEAAQVTMKPEEYTAKGPIKTWQPAEIEKVKRIPRSELFKEIGSQKHVGEPLFDVLNVFDTRIYRVAEKPERVDAKLYETPGEKKDDPPVKNYAKVFETATFTARATPLGLAYRESLGLSVGRAPFAIIYIGDGQSNEGASLESAAAAAQQAGTQLHIIPIGVPKAKDVQVEYVDAPEVFFKDDKAVFRVVISQSDCTGERANLVLRKNKTEIVKTKPIEFESGAMTVDLDYTPKDPTPPGKLDEYDIVLEGVTDEVDYENNKKTKIARTIDGKLKVLYIEDRPRWEWRVMRDMLLKDKRVGEKYYYTWLLSADERVKRQVEKHPYYKDNFPSIAELQEYHALIIGDVDAKTFDFAQVQAINSFVGEWGGGLMMIAGERYNPGSYTGEAYKPIEEMMPVLYRPTEPPLEQEETTQPHRHGYTVKLTPWAAAYPFTAFDPDPMKNQKIWSDFGQFYWHADIRRLHPMGVALLTHATARDEEGNQLLPLIAVRRYGKGNVIFIGIDETWRFRKEIGSTYHRTFWTQAVQHLGVSLLSGSTRRIDLRLGKKSAAVDQAVEIEASVFDKDYKPLKADDVKVIARHTGTGATQDVKLQRSSTEGAYKGEFIPKEEGEYTFEITDQYSQNEKGEKAKLQRTLSVRQPNIERDNPTVDLARLNRLAEMTGGRVWRLNELQGLRQQMIGQQQKTQRTLNKPLWNTWLALLLFTVCVTTEWSLRKLWNLR